MERNLDLVFIRLPHEDVPSEIAIQTVFQEKILLALRQLEHRRIDYEPFDNGLCWCEDLPAAQRICDHFDGHKIEPFSANGCADYRIPSVPETAGRVIATIYP